MKNADRPEWMRPVDIDILEMLELTTKVTPRGMWLKPGNIAVNIRKHRTYVSTRLQALLEHEFVEKNDRGFYRIADAGEDFIRYYL